jgi:hypothetical protein
LKVEKSQVFIFGDKSDGVLNAGDGRNVVKRVISRRSSVTDLAAELSNREFRRRREQFQRVNGREAENIEFGAVAGVPKQRQSRLHRC